MPICEPRREAWSSASSLALEGTNPPTQTWSQASSLQEWNIFLLFKLPVCGPCYGNPRTQTHPVIHLFQNTEPLTCARDKAVKIIIRGRWQITWRGCLQGAYTSWGLHRKIINILRWNNSTLIKALKEIKRGLLWLFITSLPISPLASPEQMA